MSIMSIINFGQSFKTKTKTKQEQGLESEKDKTTASEEQEPLTDKPVAKDKKTGKEFDLSLLGYKNVLLNINLAPKPKKFTLALHGQEIKVKIKEQEFYENGTVKYELCTGCSNGIQKEYKCWYKEDGTLSREYISYISEDGRRATVERIYNDDGTSIETTTEVHSDGATEVTIIKRDKNGNIVDIEKK